MSLQAFLGTAILTTAVYATFWFFEPLFGFNPPAAGQTFQSSLPSETTSEVFHVVPPTVDRRDLHHITRHPIFAPTRKPHREIKATVIQPTEQEETEEVAPVVAAPPDVRLLGVLIAPGGSAALLELEDREPEWAHVGIDVAGWTLEQVGETYIILAKEERSISVDIYRR